MRKQSPRSKLAGTNNLRKGRVTSAISNLRMILFDCMREGAVVKHDPHFHKLEQILLTAISDAYKLQCLITPKKDGTY